MTFYVQYSYSTIFAHFVFYALIHLREGRKGEAAGAHPSEDQTTAGPSLAGICRVCAYGID